jgi:alpha/beta superfamily hydrolase
MPLNLSQYPSAIALAAEAVNQVDHQLADMRLHLARLEGNADKISAFEANLKNDNQRRARRFEILQANHEYRHACDGINRLNTEKAQAVARLERLRNEFSVAKLETKLAIAQKLIGLEARELVGL